jgi:hypothetical protein
MHRTNIYLEEAQSSILSETANAMGLSRSELIRRLIDRGLDGDEAQDIEHDLTAIRESFGVLAGDIDDIQREPGERERYIAKLWRQ